MLTLTEKRQTLGILDSSQDPKSDPLSLTLVVWLKLIRTYDMKHEILQELGSTLWIPQTNFLNHASSRKERLSVPQEKPK